MTDTAPDRICTLCHTQFKEGGTRGVGCAVNLVVFGVLVAVVQGLRLDVVAQVALVVAGLVASAWIERRISTGRAQTCPSCGSRLTVPLGSPAGAALVLQVVPRPQLAAALPVLPDVTAANSAPAAPEPAHASPPPDGVGQGQFVWAIVAAIGAIAWAAYQVFGRG